MDTTTHQEQEDRADGLDVLDPADGTVLAHLSPGAAHATPAEDVSTGPLHEVNGVTVQALTRVWGRRPATYYLVQSHTPTVPLTRAETVGLAHTIIDTLTQETP